MYMDIHISPFVSLLYYQTIVLAMRNDYSVSLWESPRSDFQLEYLSKVGNIKRIFFLNKNTPLKL